MVLYVPAKSSFEEIPVEQMEAKPVVAGYRYWLSLCGARPYPTRSDMRPQPIRDILRHLVLIQVIDGAADFMMSIVGDEVQRAYDVPLNHRLLSDIILEAPTVFPGWMERYRRTALDGLPHGYRVTSGLDGGVTKFIQREAVVLPLGADGEVTHVVTFGKHELRPGT
ncbi:hypothetical protein FHS83_000374 [Rhizomicrobium palustre]|uniref:PAS domain-containing protein n=1 Tax=Rhizomicrobium palustre TaxID=189966 RepID=A0A846MUM9_9PROT|nr:hypothetical protein [Rhizomicrobium palustre]NIK87056.1 hypothetical protein [Rhizomicrobium palustre]